MKEKEREYHLSQKHHMKILWEEFFKSDNNTMAQDATLVEKTSIVGRVGIMLLSCEYNVEMPICSGVYSVIFHGVEVQEALENMLLRDMKSEFY